MSFAEIIEEIKEKIDEKGAVAIAVVTIVGYTGFKIYETYANNKNNKEEVWEMPILFFLLISAAIFSLITNTFLAVLVFIIAHPLITLLLLFCFAGPIFADK